MKHALFLLAVITVWIFSILPANANFLTDGAFISDLKSLIEGKKLGSELALQILESNYSLWTDFGKEYCDLRQQGKVKKKF